MAIAAFVGFLYLFRHLALLLVFFVTFERALGWGSRALTRVDWEQAAHNRGLSARQRALAHNLARSAPA